ncbi:class I SAM-dependent methyltransferase [Ensifer sp. 22521]|uniref:class I SAM-dependent methyltransferase n=1 Tax=Ensifer sp. 22521 TaxID=3453935 RepID=UPI003F86C91C
MTLNHKDKVIDKWRTENSADFGYFDTVENMLEIFWTEGGDFRKRFDTMDLTSVVEIACGKGRHAAQIVERCGNLVLVDTSRDAIDFARKRFRDKRNVRCHHSEDGESLAFIPTGSASAVFSYDAMVHFEPVTIYAYLRETCRVLKPGGRAFFHHSNYSKQPDQDFSLAPSWRNYMTSDLFRHFTHRAGLELVDHKVIAWDVPDSDALSLLTKPLL